MSCAVWRNIKSTQFRLCVDVLPLKRRFLPAFLLEQREKNKHNSDIDKEIQDMKALIVLLLWGVLLVLCWPIALLALILWPIIWLLSIPFKIIAIAAEAFLAFVKSILFLPAKILGYRAKT